jgi:serine/threonine protein kinase
MGAVYKARDHRLDRLVAIKVLSQKAATPERQARFIQEAKTASALNHPHIVTIYEIDLAGDLMFIAMEYIEGRTLEQFTPQKGLRFTDVLRYAIPAADALAAAHAIGIMHRDVKPSNIMVGAKGTVKVLDFGLAKLTSRGMPRSAPRARTPTAPLRSPPARPKPGRFWAPWPTCRRNRPKERSSTRDPTSSRSE